MSRYVVVFTPEAETQLRNIYRYLANAASPEVGYRYTSAILNHCEAMSDLPHRGNCRDDIRPGLRITHFRRRTIIAFTVSEKRVSIIGLYYGGQDYEAQLGAKRR